MLAASRRERIQQSVELPAACFPGLLSLQCEPGAVCKGGMSVALQTENCPQSGQGMGLGKPWVGVGQGCLASVPCPGPGAVGKAACPADSTSRLLSLSRGGSGAGQGASGGFWGVSGMHACQTAENGSDEGCSEGRLRG